MLTFKELKAVTDPPTPRWRVTKGRRAVGFIHYEFGRRGATGQFFFDPLGTIQTKLFTSDITQLSKFLEQAEKDLA